MIRPVSHLVIFVIFVAAATILLPSAHLMPIQQTHPNNQLIATTFVSAIDSDKQSASAHNVGARTCASSTCHGSPRADTENANRIRRDEYTIWLEQDPHARAYTDLDSPLGKQIFEKLGLTNDGQISRSNMALYKLTYNNCLECHSTTIKTIKPNGNPETIATEGISCEACHGAASNWRSTHYTSDFTQLTVKEKTEQGLTDVDNLWQRTNSCVKCHVGSATAEVNHDLIAAGHPVLKFEMTAYSAQMPKHWKTLPPTKTTDKHRETNLWLMGQISSLSASLKQLRARADQSSGLVTTGSQRHRVWPELSESNCYACHHDLDLSDTWRPSIASPRNGQKHLLPVNDWYAYALASIAKVDGKTGNKAAQQFSDNWKALETAMENSLSPNPAEVLACCDDALAALSDWLKPSKLHAKQRHPHYDHHQILNLTAAVMQGDGLDGILQNWDRATQAYLALYALASAQDNQGKTSVTASENLRAARDLLAFPHHTDYRFASPSNFKGVLSSDAANTNNRTAIRAELLEIINTLKSHVQENK